MGSRVLVVLGLLALPRLAAAYPIPPQTLWSLTADSAIVAVAETKSIERIPRDEASWVDTVAVLKVLDTWRGRELETIRVPFPAGMICPAPPRFVEGEMVLVFLSVTDGGYHVQGLSYGTLYPHFDELQDYEDAVRSVDPKATKAERTAWLARVAAKRSTRWHGIYELQASADSRHHYYDDRAPAEYTLSPDDQQVLARGIVQEPEASPMLVAALRLLKGFVDPRLDRIGVAALDELMHEREAPYFFADLMRVVLERVGREVAFPEPPKKKEGELDDPLLGMPVAEAEWAFEQWPKLRATIDLDTAGIDFTIRLPRVLGTGSGTPL